jgi:Ca2+-binding RTX toxin-like protein
MATITGTNGYDKLNDLFRKSDGTVVDLGTNDTIYGLGGGDTIDIHNGNDTVYAGTGNDTIFDRGTGNDRMYGESGNDHFYVGLGNDTVSGGTGTDWVSFTFSNQIALVDLQAGHAIAQGVDTLVSIENVTGSYWNDVMYGSSVANTMLGYYGDDTINGRLGDDLLYGQAGNDTLLGSIGNDRLVGDIGNDRLSGGTGNDDVWGGKGNDVMTGGTGTDVFWYGSKTDIAAFDTITDFQHGIDKINLAAIDARPDVAGNQAFFFDSSPDGSTEEFFDGLSDDWSGLLSGEPGPWINGDRGEIEYRHSGGYTYVYLAFGDGLIDSSIRLNGTVTLTASDFVL